MSGVPGPSIRDRQLRTSDVEGICFYEPPDDDEPIYLYINAEHYGLRAFKDVQQHLWVLHSRPRWVMNHPHDYRPTVVSAPDDNWVRAAVRPPAGKTIVDVIRELDEQLRKKAGMEQPASSQSDTQPSMQLNLPTGDQAFLLEVIKLAVQYDYRIAISSGETSITLTPQEQTPASS